MQVAYYHERPGRYTGNIIWSPSYPMKHGKFPADHPSATKMKDFRALGYWASCFPEGDGITMKCERGQNTEQVVADIKTVFGWEVKVKRGDND